MDTPADIDAEAFAGTIVHAQTITGRGTFVLLAPDISGRIAPGRHVIVPRRDGGEAEAVVASVEIWDGKDADGRPTSGVALGLGAALAPDTIRIGARVREGGPA